MEVKRIRPYQQKAHDDVFSAWSKDSNILLTVPTGGGKTFITSQIIKTLLKSNNRVLFLVNRDILLTQSAATFRDIGAPSIITAKNVVINDHNLAVAMHGTLKNRLKKSSYFDYFSQFTHVIIDECHYGDFRWAFEHEALKGAKKLGLTATPISAKKDLPLKNFYQNIIEPVSTKELIADGFLMPAVYYSVETDLSGLEVRGGEYTEESQEKVFGGKATSDEVVAQYIEHCKGRKCIVFNTTQKMAVEQCEAFNQAGIKASVLVSGNEDIKGLSDIERKKTLHDFQYGDTMILSNTAILTAGADIPICSAVILRFATTQRAKKTQCEGRGARPHPESGKTDFIVIDIGANHHRFGLFDMMWERKGKIQRLINSWSELFWNPYTPKWEELPPVKDCPKCAAMLAIQARTCSNCGFVFPVKAKEDEPPVALTKIEVVKDPEKMIKTWIHLANSGKAKGGENFVLKMIRQNLGIQGLRLYAQMQRKEPAWVDSYYMNRKESLWRDIKKTFPVREIYSFIGNDIKKQLESGVDFFKVEIHYREKVLPNPKQYIQDHFPIN
jgi:superfamily II DNA or RNA helicase